MTRFRPTACVRCGNTERRHTKTNPATFTCAACLRSLDARPALFASVTHGPAVYEVHDADGVVLYIGSTGDVRTRLRQHARVAPWRDLAARVDIIPARSVAAARAIERRLIALRRPRWNTFGVAS